MADFQFNTDNVMAPVQKTNRRTQCHDLKGALSYLSERIGEMLIDEDYSAWIQEDDGGARGHGRARRVRGVPERGRDHRGVRRGGIKGIISENEYSIVR